MAANKTTECVKGSIRISADMLPRVTMARPITDSVPWYTKIPAQPIANSQPIAEQHSSQPIGEQDSSQKKQPISTQLRFEPLTNKNRLSNPLHVTLVNSKKQSDKNNVKMQNLVFKPNSDKISDTSALQTDESPEGSPLVAKFKSQDPNSHPASDSVDLGSDSVDPSSDSRDLSSDSVDLHSDSVDLGSDSRDLSSDSVDPSSDSRDLHSDSADPEDLARYLARSVICPGGEFECPDRMTCCMMTR